MSFLRGSPQPTGAINPERIEMATAELDMITDVFNRLVSTCYTKCIGTRFADGELNKGESVCVDRCVAKFFEVNKKVGEKMQQMGANTQAGGSFGGL
ncbi:mitochondrial import inner membrane translocase subunit [Pyrrhoderma noxium]|uniref:Mitochondrial import inner membrane translocase subunit n=1 Tax=Pyrrhoderma noxium TaxID=2282107 RepID=A0A286UQE9_9AGAM|nr:mitochondrial import inner membrane translocase subunit [Pyrrhoderma noxium]